MQHAGCPTDPMWTRYGSKYYGMSDDKFHYSAAGAYCSARGGKLASIHTEEGFTAVATAIGESVQLWVFLMDNFCVCIPGR